MRLAILAGGDGWHVRDLRRAELAIRRNCSTFADSPPGSASAPIRWPALTPSSSAPCRRGRWSRLFSVWTVASRSSRRHYNVSIRRPHWKRALTNPGDRKAGCRGLASPTDDRLPNRGRRAGDLPIARRRRGREAALRFRGAGPGPCQRSGTGLANLSCFGANESRHLCSGFRSSPGWDLRVLTLGGRVLAAMRRHAKNDWRTNVAQGGRAEAVSAPPAKNEALEAALTVGADFAGVDLMPAGRGNVVLEVNAVPGWRALAAACGVDVAANVVRYLAGESQ